MAEIALRALRMAEIGGREERVVSAPTSPGRSTAKAPLVIVGQCVARTGRPLDPQR